MAAAFWLKGATGEVTTECSAPGSTMKVIVRPPTFISTVGSWGPREKEPCPLQSESTPARPTRFPPQGFSQYRLGFEGPFRFGHSFFQCPFSLQYAHWSFAKGALGFPPFGGWGLPIFAVSVSFSAAVRRVALFFSLLSTSLLAANSLFMKTIGNLYQLSDIHPGKALQLLQFSSDIWGSLCHKRGIYHLLTFWCLGVKQGVYMVCFT